MKTTKACIDEHYETSIFPLVKDGKKKFNWIAGLFSPFWFGYKGLWRIWFLYLMPFAIMSSILPLIMGTRSGIIIGLSIVMIMIMGSIANKEYYKKFQLGNVKGKGRVWPGIGGLFLYVIISYFSEFMYGLIAGLISRL